MKFPALLPIIFLAILTCSFSGKKKNKQYKFEGKWTETWGVGQKTDVNYHDRYTIAADSDGRREITCQSSDHFRFIDVVFDKDLLTFKMINMTGNDTLPYVLRLNKKSSKMIGTAISVRGEKTNIEWARDRN